MLCNSIVSGKIYDTILLFSNVIHSAYYDKVAEHGEGGWVWVGLKKLCGLHLGFRGL